MFPPGAAGAHNDDETTSNLDISDYYFGRFVVMQSDQRDLIDMLAAGSVDLDKFERRFLGLQGLLGVM